MTDAPEDKGERLLFEQLCDRDYAGDRLASIAAGLGAMSKAVPQEGSFSKILAIYCNEVAKAGRELMAFREKPTVETREQKLETLLRGLLQNAWMYDDDLENPVGDQRDANVNANELHEIAKELDALGAAPPMGHDTWASLWPLQVGEDDEDDGTAEDEDDEEISSRVIEKAVGTTELCDPSRLKIHSTFLADGVGPLWCVVATKQGNWIRAQVINGGWNIGFDLDTGMATEKGTDKEALPHALQAHITYTGSFKGFSDRQYNDAIAFAQEQVRNAAKEG
ncbi:hypothetical protein [Roseococcus pinisoli]|uniref:Uncharacterized protein n=1 Tax=Roseococcus pinisoli TaxID=2835040 RepID=A0ABS5QG37_9PROT|nr:hypothetical protein [Roseococcus pinisoli]MBS7812276.1 hypothetical protein [Roseococcus pinisoli]